MTRHDADLCDALHPGKTCHESANDTIDNLMLRLSRAQAQAPTDAREALARAWDEGYRFWYDNDRPPEHRDYGKGNPYRAALSATDAGQREVVTADGLHAPFNAQSDAEAAAYKAGWADAQADERDRLAPDAGQREEQERAEVAPSEVLICGNTCEHNHDSPNGPTGCCAQHGPYMYYCGDCTGRADRSPDQQADCGVEHEGECVWVRRHDQRAATCARDDRNPEQP